MKLAANEVSSNIDADECLEEEGGHLCHILESGASLDERTNPAIQELLSYHKLYISSPKLCKIPAFIIPGQLLAWFRTPLEPTKSSSFVPHSDV